MRGEGEQVGQRSYLQRAAARRPGGGVHTPD